MEHRMTDLHTHILPGIDDGAKNLEESLKLLRNQKEQGVEHIVFTPHFNFEKKKISEFREARKNSLDLLINNAEFKDMDFSYLVGSEVYFSVNLADCDIDDLCISGTNYVLIELPTQIKPHGLKYTMDNILNKGYIPIIAHVERYSYMMKDPTLLYELVEKGCFAQINAETLIEGGAHSVKALKLIKWGIVQLVCSDCHSMKKRIPNLKDGYEVIRKKIGSKYVDLLEENSDLVFNNRNIEIEHLRKPFNVLGTWI